MIQFCPSEAQKYYYHRDNSPSCKLNSVNIYDRKKDPGYVYLETDSEEIALILQYDIAQIASQKNPASKYAVVQIRTCKDLYCLGCCLP